MDLGIINGEVRFNMTKEDIDFLNSQKCRFSCKYCLSSTHKDANGRQCSQHDIRTCCIKYKCKFEKTYILKEM